MGIENLALLPCYHERCKISSVNSQKNHSKHSPDVCHKPCSKSTWTIDVYSGLEKYGPNQPIRAKQ